MPDETSKPETAETFKEAVSDGDLDAVMKALEEGLDIETPLEDEGETALHLAIALGEDEMARFLIEKGANPFHRTARGLSLLHSAAVNEYPDEIIPELLAKGLDPNAQNLYGWTPVHYAISYGNLSLVRLLLEKGGNPHYPTNKGETAFDVAREMGYTGIGELLEGYREDYEAPPEEELSQFVSDETAEEEAESIVLEEPNRESELTIEEDCSDDEEVLRRVRETAAAWAQAIPHHGIKDFGGKLEIQSVHYRPAYLLGLQTLYDHRQVASQAVPYTGQTVPPREFSSPGEVDPWDFALMEPEGFQSLQDQYVVNGSQHVLTCHRCEGHGKLLCPSCGGKGKETCHTCGGKGSTRCYSCLGSGRRSCSSCGGSGQTSFTRYETHYDSDGNSYQTSYLAHQNCGSCGGTGRRTCTACGGTGRRTCSSCGGSGIIVCSRCGGTGTITCPTCQGQKQLYHYYTIDQSLHAWILKQCILEAHVYEQYPRFYIDAETAEGAVVVDETEGALPKELLDRTHLSQVYQQTLDHSYGETPFDGQGGSTRIARQRARVVQMDAYDVVYRYENSEYRLLVWGWQENLQVYAQESPFSKLRDEFIEKAKNRQRLHAWGKAFNWLDKADDLDVFDEEEEIYEMKERIERRMGWHYRIGLILGSLLGGAGIGYLSLDFYRTSRFFHPGLNRLFASLDRIQGVHSTVMTGLFLVLLLLSQNRMHRFMKRYYSNKIRHEWLRWLFPPLAALFSAGVIWLLIWVINASGLTLILSGAARVAADGVSAVISWFTSNG